MGAPLETAKVIDLANKWARLHKNERMRARMDECLTGLSDDDARRVVLCGQRIVGGLPMKVLPAAIATTKGGSNDKPKQRASPKGRRQHADAA